MLQSARRLAASLFLAVACTAVVRAEIGLPDFAPSAPANGPAAIAVPAPTTGAGETTAVVKDSEEIMLFKNGDTLHGGLTSIGAPGVIWRREDSKSPLEFATTNLHGIRLRRGFDAPVAAGISRIELTNGDALYGTVVTLDEKTLALDTTYAGRLVIRTPMILAIYPDRGRESAMFNGLGKIEEWTASGNWEIKNNRLQGMGTIGRDLKLPDMARIAIDVKWKGRYPNFSLSLYSSDFSNNSANSYMLAISSTSIYLNRNSPRGNSRNLGHQNLQALMQMNGARFEILCNKEARTIALLIDGTLVKQWTDSQDWNGSGTGFIIFSQDNSSRMSYGNITVSKWDGKLPDISTEAAQNAEDAIEFANEDRVTGVLKSIADGKVMFETPYAPPLAVPLARIRRLSLGAGKAQRPRRNTGDVEAFFPTGDRVTIKMASLGDRSLVGWSESLGDVTLKSDAFVALRFNLYDEATTSEDDEDEDENGPSQIFSQWLNRGNSGRRAISIIDPEEDIF